MRHGIKYFRLAACALLAVPLWLFAEPGSPRPIPHPGGGGGGGPSRSTTGRSGDGGVRGDRNKEDLEQFREKMQEFCKKHSPRRWAALEENAHGDKNPLKYGGMFFRFRGLMMLENQDPDLYEIKVKQIEIEDEEYGLMKDVREARKAEDAAKIEAITPKLRELSAKYIASRIDEHAHRITNLEKAIKSEQNALAYDKDKQQSLVEERVKALLSDNPKPSRGHGSGGSGNSAPPTDNEPPQPPDDK
jgi:hypothetical protein